VTPDGGHNPSFRIYEADASTGQLLDYVQYRLDLAGQGRHGERVLWGELRVAPFGSLLNHFHHSCTGLINNVNTSAHAYFFEAYRATVEYNMTSIAPSEWLKVVKRMEVRAWVLKM
jgi:hypothetical protein